MSGFRANCGYGVLNRAEGNAAFTALPWSDSLKTGPKKILDKSITTAGYDEGDCIHQLVHRFGVGLDLSINRNRNNNYHQDIGLREITAVSSGMYDIDFTINGAFSPECSDWLEYGVMSEPAVIKSASEFVPMDGNPNVGYVKTGGVTGKIPIKKDDYNTYKKMVDDSKQIGSEETLEVKVYSYLNLDGPKYFDIGYEQINENTTGGGLNEIGILTGCVIDSFSISYESGGDAAIKFTINGIALKEYVMTTSTNFDYNAILDPIPEEILVTGCLSVNEGQGYETVAQTDSASVTLSNNLTKLGSCLELTYSSVALGALGYELSTSTYSNDPNKYFRYMYGLFDCEDMDAEDYLGPENYSIRKNVKPIPKMKIRSAGDVHVIRSPQIKPNREYISEFLDLNMTKVYVGSSNRSYSVDSAIMDEPDLRPSKLQIVVGHIPKK